MSLGHSENRAMISLHYSPRATGKYGAPSHIQYGDAEITMCNRLVVSELIPLESGADGVDHFTCKRCVKSAGKMGLLSSQEVYDLTT